MSKILFMFCVTACFLTAAMEHSEEDMVDSLEFIGVMDMLEHSYLDSPAHNEQVYIDKKQLINFIEHTILLAQKHNRLIAEQKK